MDTLTPRQAAWLERTIEANPYPFTEGVDVDALTLQQATVLVGRVFGSTITPEDGPAELGPSFTTDDTGLAIGVHVAAEEELLHNDGQQRIWAAMTGQDTDDFDRAIDNHMNTIETLYAVAETLGVTPVVTTNMRLSLERARAAGRADWLDVGARDYAQRGRRAPVVAGSTVDDDDTVAGHRTIQRELSRDANASPDPAPGLLDDLDAPVPYVLAESE